MIDGFYTAEEIKPLLGLKSRPGDLRTLNKYVKNGKFGLMKSPTIASPPDNLTVGGSLYLSNTGITSKEREKVKNPQNMVEFKLSVQAKLSW